MTPQKRVEFQVTDKQLFVINFSLRAQRLHFFEAFAQFGNLFVRSPLNNQAGDVFFKNQP